MVVTGLLVAPVEGCREEARTRLEALSWAEIHYEDGEGRWVVTIESEDTGEAIERNKELQEYPEILMAEMAEHFVGEETSSVKEPDGAEALRAIMTSKRAKPEVEQ